MSSVPSLLFLTNKSRFEEFSPVVPSYLPYRYFLESMPNTPVTDASSNPINSAILKYQNCRRKANADLDDNVKKVREAVTRLKGIHQKNEKLCNDAFQRLIDLISQSDASNSLTLPPTKQNKSGLRSQTED